MAALTGPRKTARTEGSFYTLPIAAGKTIQQGALTAAGADGKATPADAAEGLTALGCAVFVDAIANRVTVERGCWLWENDAGTPVTQADIGRDCYMLDDQTVTAAADDGAASDAVSYSVAGKVLGFEDGLVIVETL